MTPHEPVPTDLHWNLLDEPLIRWREAERGDVRRSSLPELFAAMVADTVHDFPALRPHQRHPWHAFLTQLAAIAIHRAGQALPWTDVADWRAALLALTPGDSDGAAWCMVSPPNRPALLQAPVLTGIDEWSFGTRTPDVLDMLGTAKNHDLKQSRMQRAEMDDWLFALISLQTQAGSNSGAYKGISRMNSGAGSRPCVGVAESGTWSGRWRSDVGVLLRTREETCDRYGFPNRTGICLTWLIPWDDSAPIRFSALDPHYIEICRRVRLTIGSRGVVAATFKTPSSRIEEGVARKGVTGDPWAPIDREEVKIMAVPKAGFGYERVSQLLLAKRYQASPAQELDGRPGSESLELVCMGIAADGNSKTAGYHERRIRVAPKLRRLLAGTQRVIAETIIEQRVHAVKAIIQLQRECLMVLLTNGKPIDLSKDQKAAQRVRPKVDQLIQHFERREDARFFDDLAVEVESMDEGRNIERLHWLSELVSRAEAALVEAFDLGPRGAMLRYKARSAALRRFHGALRGPKALWPDLAAHYEQQGRTYAATLRD